MLRSLNEPAYTVIQLAGIICQVMGGKYKRFDVHVWKRRMLNKCNSTQVPVSILGIEDPLNNPHPWRWSEIDLIVVIIWMVKAQVIAQDGSVNRSIWTYLL